MLNKFLCYKFRDCTPFKKQDQAVQTLGSQLHCQTEVGRFYLNFLKFLMFKLGALDSVANPAYPM